MGKSLKFSAIWMTGRVNLYHWPLKFITYHILTGGFWVLRLHFRIASQLSSPLMNLKVLHTVLWKGRNTDILLPGLFYHHIPLTVPVTHRVPTRFLHSGLLLLNWISVQLLLANSVLPHWPRRVWLDPSSNPRVVEFLACISVTISGFTRVGG